MQIFNFPTFGHLFTPSRSSFDIVANTKMSVSEVNMSQSIEQNPGEGFEVSYHFSVIEKEQANALRLHLLKLRGHTNLTRLIDPLYETQLGFLGTPLVDGAGQYGYALNVKNLTANQTCARAGERFMLDGQLNELLDDVNSDATGKATLNLAIEVRKPTTNNVALTTNAVDLNLLARWKDPKQIQQFASNRRLLRNVRLDFTGAR
ncbi:hypothetical protein [Glaciecola sp. 1036]|uniref:hypothetical protein n=1 Tax=Alteromonadaceae TaxID=72275 RepID=UPI003D06EF18